MAQPGMIDEYLFTLRSRLGPRLDADDVLAEVEDHLREAAARHRRSGKDPSEAERVALAAFGTANTVSDAFRRAGEGAAVPTSLTRRLDSPQLQLPSPP